MGMWTKPSAIFPEFRGGGREEITLRHLLTHTSGLPFAPANIAELLQAGATAEELIAHGYTDPLLFPPGTGQSYSDTGYGLAGLMAAEVAGVSFPELIRARVLEPAGLTQTFLGSAGRAASAGGAGGRGQWGRNRLGDLFLALRVADRASGVWGGGDGVRRAALPAAFHPQRGTAAPFGRRIADDDHRSNRQLPERGRRDFRSSNGAPDSRSRQGRG